MIISLTGGIASGKSLCSDWFAAHAVSVIDADVIARTVVAQGEPALQELVAVFGNDILQADGSLNRAALRAGWLNHDAVMMEQIVSIKHAGADLIASYFAKEVVKLL